MLTSRFLALIICTRRLRLISQKASGFSSKRRIESSVDLARRENYFFWEIERWKSTNLSSNLSNSLWFESLSRNVYAANKMNIKKLAKHWANVEEFPLRWDLVIRKNNDKYIWIKKFSMDLEILDNFSPYFLALVVK